MKNSWRSLPARISARKLANIIRRIPKNLGSRLAAFFKTWAKWNMRLQIPGNFLKNFYCYFSICFLLPRIVFSQAYTRHFRIVFYKLSECSYSSMLCVWTNVEVCFSLAGTFGNVMADRTVCMNAKQTNHLHYNVHSLYGWSQTLITLE